MEGTQKTFAKEAIRTMHKDIAEAKSRGTTGLAEFEEPEAEEKDQKFLEKLEQIWLQKQQVKKEPAKTPAPEVQPKIQPKAVARETAKERKNIPAPEAREPLEIPSPPEKTDEEKALEKERKYIEELKKRVLEERARIIKQKELETLKAKKEPEAQKERPPEERLTEEISAEKIRKITLEKRAEIQEREELKRIGRKREWLTGQKDQIAQKKVPLEERKNQILRELQDAESLLSGFYEKEGTLRKKIEDIELQERASSSPEDQKRAELKRWEAEESLQKLAKERWQAEDRRLDIQTLLENAEKEYQRLIQKETDLEIEEEKIAEEERRINLAREKRTLEKRAEDLALKIKPLELKASQLKSRIQPLQERLEEIKKREGQVEQKIKELEDRIKKTKDPGEKKNLEKELWVETEKRHAVEKEKWQIQDQKTKLDKDLELLAGKKEGVLQKEGESKSKIREIDILLGLAPLPLAEMEKEEGEPGQKVLGQIKKDLVAKDEKTREEFLQKLRQEREERKETASQEKQSVETLEQEAQEEALKPQEPPDKEPAGEDLPQKTSIEAPENAQKIPEPSVGLPPIKKEGPSAKRPEVRIPELKIVLEREQKLSAQESERERVKRERIEELKRRLQQIHLQEESKRREFAQEVASHKPSKPAIPEIKPLPEKEGKTELIIRTAKPSAGSKILSRAMVAIFSLLALGGVIGFWYWMIYIRPNQPQSPPTTPKPPEEEVVRPGEPIPLPVAVIRVDETQILEAENRQDVPLALIAALEQETTTSRFIRLIIKDQAAKKFYDLEAFFEATAVNTPPGFFDRIDQNSYTFFHHLLNKDEASRRHHFGLVAQVKNRSGLFDYLQDWEETMEADAQLLLKFLESSRPPIQNRFGQFVHKETQVRCLPFEIRVDFGICWSLKSSSQGDFFILTSSGQTAREIIDRL